MPQARHHAEIAEGDGLGSRSRLRTSDKPSTNNCHSACQLGSDSEIVRVNVSRGGNKVTLPSDVLEPLPSAGVSFFLELSTDQMAQPAASSLKTPQKHYG